MIITYFRSSSYNAHNMCPQQYFIEYNLGWRGLSGQKADKGTIVHKVLEILAFIKMYQQDEKVSASEKDADINKTRKKYMKMTLLVTLMLTTMIYLK